MLFFTVFRPIKLRKTRYKPFESCIVHQYHSLENRYGFQGFSLFFVDFYVKEMLPRETRTICNLRFSPFFSPVLAY